MINYQESRKLHNAYSLTIEKFLSPMKIKKSKHVHQDRGYTPVVNCKLTSRRLVCGTETDIQGMAVAVAHPQKVDIEQMAHDISHATTATPTDVKLVWDHGHYRRFV